jgi:hypothetical protein
MDFSNYGRPVCSFKINGRDSVARGDTLHSVLCQLCQVCRLSQASYSPFAVPIKSAWPSQARGIQKGHLNMQPGLVYAATQMAASFLGSPSKECYPLLALKGNRSTRLATPTKQSQKCQALETMASPRSYYRLFPCNNCKTGTGLRADFGKAQVAPHPALVISLTGPTKPLPRPLPSIPLCLP